MWEKFNNAYPKSDNFMSTTNKAKARCLFKHNLKSKFQIKITFRQTDDF